MIEPQLINQYLSQKNVMQLSTSVDNLPWACTVHFYSDEDNNIYWISTPERRHSREIAINQNVAVTIMVHENTPDENYVIGISMTGRAEKIEELPDENIVSGYMNKLEKDPNLPDDIRSGINPHRFYKMTPNLIVLFDNKNFPGDPRQDINL